MTCCDTPGPIDYRRAVRLLLFTAPDNTDIAGINAVLEEMNSDGRATQGILAVCDIAHIRDPALRTEQGTDALRQVVAALALQTDQ